jgi:hypothetical protein
VPYHFRGLRIVNGAQTVSSIGKAMLLDRDAVARAQVPIRFVALDTKGPRFGARIAYATNRANPMLPRDFLAMDHVQQRLRDEFALTWGRAYVIRANDHPASGDGGCSVLEAVIAMVCGRPDATSLLNAKNDVSLLWRTQGEHYRRLFNDDTSAVEVWRRVRTLRMVMAELHRSEGLSWQREKSVAVLGDLLVASMVFRLLGDDGIDDVRSTWEGGWAKVPAQTDLALQTLVSAVDFALRSGPEPKNNCRTIVRMFRSERWLDRELPTIVAYLGKLPRVDGRESGRWPSEPEFHLTLKGTILARGRQCDGGFLVQANSFAAVVDQSSLSTPQLRHRRNLRDSLGFVESGEYLRLTRDVLFESPSQAAAVLLGHNVNGADGWHTAESVTYNKVMQERSA